MLSPYLNIGLLHPLEVVQAAQLAYLDNSSDWELNSIEGFIPQVLGWREYMHGVYVYLDDDYSERNWFNHTHPLPAFYWDFLARHYEKLKDQPRMTQILRNLERLSPSELQKIRSLASNWHTTQAATVGQGNAQ